MSDVMSTASTTAIKAGRQIGQTASPEGERARVGQLAQEFEAMLMLQMIRQMRQSMLEEESQSEGLGASTMRDTFDVEFSRHLAAAGGFGLGTLLTRQVEAGSTPSAAEPRAEAAHMSESRPPSPTLRRIADDPLGEPTIAIPLTATTSSPYGWRADPFTGRSRFHGGVDLRAAYGTDVPAAAGGEVVFAGERGGYGNLVILRHAHGLETRYGHLSSVDVRAGEAVEAGGSIGRVGSTGRSTAPHLHFEVLVNGERVDPGHDGGSRRERTIKVRRTG